MGTSPQKLGRATPWWIKTYLHASSFWHSVGPSPIQTIKYGYTNTQTHRLLSGSSEAFTLDTIDSTQYASEATCCRWGTVWFQRCCCIVIRRHVPCCDRHRTDGQLQWPGSACETTNFCRRHWCFPTNPSRMPSRQECYTLHRTTNDAIIQHRPNVRSKTDGYSQPSLYLV